MGERRERQGKGPRLRIEIRHGAIPNDWDELAAADPAAGPGHGSAWWRTCVEASGRAEPVAVTARWEGRLVGGIAAIEERLGPIRRIFALPFGTHGGPLIAGAAPGGWERPPGGEEAATWSADADSQWQRGTPLGGRLALALFRIPSVAEIHLVDATGAAGEELAFVPGVECRFPVRGSVDLRKGRERVWTKMALQCRRRIEDAGRRGLAVRAPRSVEERRGALRGLIDAVSADGGDRSEMPRRMLEALSQWPAAGERDRIDISFAEIDGAPPVAATLNLVSAAHIQNIVVISGGEGRSLGADDLLHWHAMESGVAQGRSVYSLGASEDPAAGASLDSLGASAVRIRTWHWVAPLWRWMRGRR